MKTLVDIPQGAIALVQKTFNLRTKKEAIIFALNEVIRYDKLRKLAALSGTFAEDEIMSQSQLRAMRDRDTIRNFSLR